MQAIPFVVWLRPVSRQERVGEQSAVVWKFVYVRPAVGDPLDVRRLDQPAVRLHRREADVVEDDVEHVRRALRRRRLRVRLPVGRRVLDVDVDRCPGTAWSWRRSPCRVDVEARPPPGPASLAWGERVIRSWRAQWWKPRGRPVVNGLRLLLEARQLPLRSATSRSARSWREAAPHDDPQRREVLPVLRERVRRDLPAALAQRVRDVEDGEVVDVVAQLEREHGQLVAVREQLERPELGDPRREPRRDVARVLRAPCGSRRSRAGGSCSTARRPARRGARSSARTSACCRRGS